MARKRRRRRAVSFVGNNDLRAAGVLAGGHPLRENDLGPIWRFVSRQIDVGELGNGDCILLLDDRPGSGEREKFASWLGQRIALAGCAIDVVRLSLTLEGKPTHLSALFAEAFRQIPEESGYETQFLLSPGTPAMYATLVLAAEYLRLTRPRLFESSLEEGVVEVMLPYEIGLRPRQRSWRAPNAQRRPVGRLPGLLPDTVLNDAGIRATYEALHQQATLPGRWAMLLYGPSGSGKTHAARQLALWRGCDSPRVLSAESPPEPHSLDRANTVIVRDLHNAGVQWPAWRRLICDLPDTQFVFLWRVQAGSGQDIDRAVQAGLAAGGVLRIPGLAERDDRMALVESFARRAGKWDGKAKERCQYALMKHDLARNLHELEAWMSLVAAHSDGPHPSEIAVERATRQLHGVQAQALLARLAQAIADQSFVGRLPLDTLLKCAEALSVMVQEASGDAQEVIAARFGIKRTTLFDSESVASRRRALDQVLDACPELNFPGD